MTTAQDGELLTRVGPGTPMGELMREYWIPAAKSSELTADGNPMRLMLLGEKLIAFRDSAGRVGIMDHRCPHRCASFFFGRNGEDGIRCAYHGWKFDVDGKCLDQPNLPRHQQFKDRVHAKAYKTAERNGLIWVYMGKRDQAPPLPQFEASLMPEGEMRIAFAMRECNWLQAAEGDIDTSHISFLHFGGTKAEEMHPESSWRITLQNPTPEYQVAETPWGTMYGAYRPALDPGQTYWRISHFLFPFWTIPPEGDFATHVVTRAWVPMDDTHTMFVHLSWTKSTSRPRTRKDGSAVPGADFEMHHLPNTTDWFGRWRLKENMQNDYMIDRDAQRSSIYSGITGIHLQDQAITESMGPITDYSFEHLAASDRMVVATRRRLVEAIRAMEESGMVPPGVDNPQICLGARGGDFIAPDGMNWKDAYAQNLGAATNPTGGLQAAD